MGGRGERYRQGRGGAGRPGGRAVHLRGRLAQGPGPARPRHGQAAENPGAQSGQHRGGEEQSKGPPTPVLAPAPALGAPNSLILPSLAPWSRRLSLSTTLHIPWLFLSLSRARPSSCPCRPPASLRGLGYLEGAGKTLDSSVPCTGAEVGAPGCSCGGRRPALSSLPRLDLG